MPFRQALKDKKTYALVVEDDVDQRTFLLLVLQRAGINTVGVSDGLEALKLLIEPFMNRDACLPGLIFLDWSMPEFNGGQLLTTISLMSEEIRRIPIVLTTAHKVEVPRGVTLLRKPYFTEQLEECLREHLDDG